MYVVSCSGKVAAELRLGQQKATGVLEDDDLEDGLRSGSANRCDVHDLQ